MYVSVPFWRACATGAHTGFSWIASGARDLDAGASQPDVMSFGVAGGDLTYYVFAGPTPAAVLARYADLTGHMPLPPRWALGYEQSRWSYFPEAQVRYVAERVSRAPHPLRRALARHRLHGWLSRLHLERAALPRSRAGCCANCAPQASSWSRSSIPA